MSTFTDTLQQKRLDASNKAKELERDSTTQAIAKSGDIDSLLSQVKELTLAQYMGGQKPAIVLTDQTDLGDKMVQLGDKLADSVRSIDTTDLNSEQLHKLSDVVTGIERLASTVSSRTGDAIKQHRELIAAVKSLKLSTVVNVPDPKVTVNEKTIDFAPLQATIKEYFKAPEVAEGKLDLNCYKAQDINNDVKDMQYIGFVNPDGHWYIIENDVKGNKLRYVFGVTGYPKAFKKASSYQYHLLNEAIDAL